MTVRLSTETKRNVAETAAVRAVAQIRRGLVANLWQCIRPSLMAERPDVFTADGDPLISQDQLDELKQRTQEQIRYRLMELRRSGEWHPTQEVHE